MSRDSTPSQLYLAPLPWERSARLLRTEKGEERKEGYKKREAGQLLLLYFTFLLLDLPTTQLQLSPSSSNSTNLRLSLSLANAELELTLVSRFNMSSNSTADVASEELSNPYDRYVPSLAMVSFSRSVSSPSISRFGLADPSPFASSPPSTPFVQPPPFHHFNQAVIFLIIFSGSTLLHLLQIFVFRRPGNVKKSMKWMVVFPICGFGECHHSSCYPFLPTFISASPFSRAPSSSLNSER